MIKSCTSTVFWGLVRDLKKKVPIVALPAEEILTFSL